MIPFKREDWTSEEKMYTQEEILERHNFQANKFRVPEGGAYKKRYGQERGMTSDY